MTQPKQPSTWDKRKRRVMGDDPDDPSLALPDGKWVVEAGVRKWVEKKPQEKK